MSQTIVQPKNTNQRESFCKLLTWWKKPNEVNDQELLRRIMNLGTWEMWQWAWQNFTEESFVHCLTDGLGMEISQKAPGTIGTSVYPSLPYYPIRKMKKLDFHAR